MKIEEKMAQVGTARIYYEVAGKGKPVILLHGLSGSTRWWKWNIRDLAQHYQVISIDMIGFGRSRGQPFVLRDAAGLLEKWMEEAGIECASLIGHSMGGYIAAGLAARSPERVERLILVDALAMPIGRTVFRSALGLVEALRYLPLNFLPVMFQDALQAGPVTLIQAIREVMAADQRPILGRIRMPTLILWGEHDTLLPVEAGRQLHQCLPQAEYQVIAGAGHNPMWDRPEPFNRAVLDFLGRGR